MRLFAAAVLALSLPVPPARAVRDCSRFLDMMKAGELPEASAAGACQDFVAAHLRAFRTDERGRCDAAWRLTGYSVKPGLGWGALFGRLDGGLSRSEILRRREQETSPSLKGLAGWANSKAERRGLVYSFLFGGDKVRLFSDAAAEKPLGEFLWLVPDDDDWHQLYHAALSAPPRPGAAPLLYGGKTRYAAELGKAEFKETVHLLDEGGEVLRSWPLMDAADEVLGISSTGRTLYLGVRLEPRFGEEHAHLPLAVSDLEFRFVEPSPALSRQKVVWSGPGELIGGADYCERGTVRDGRKAFRLARCGLSPETED